MKIFENKSKVNFVDENNVFVGYDLKQECCEEADWFISTKKEKEIEVEKVRLKNSKNFDLKSYRKES